MGLSSVNRPISTNSVRWGRERQFLPNASDTAPSPAGISFSHGPRSCDVHSGALMSAAPAGYISGSRFVH